MPANPVKIGNYSCGRGQPLLVIAGPCVLEDEALVLSIARRLKQISLDLAVPIIFKASFDKANRTSLSSYRGPGLERRIGNFVESKRNDRSAGYYRYTRIRTGGGRGQGLRFDPDSRIFSQTNRFAGGCRGDRQARACQKGQFMARHGI